MTAFISRDELRDALDQHAVTVVDASSPGSYGKRHLPDAINLLAEDPDDRITAVLPNKTAAIVTYSTDDTCQLGPAFAERLGTLGYTDVRAYHEGITEWVAAGLAIDQPKAAKLNLSELALSPTAALLEGHPRAGVDISIFVTHTRPGRAVELHVHPYAETFLLLQGRGRWTRGQEMVELETDQILVVPPHTPHGFRNTGDVTLLVVSVHERGTLRQTFLGKDPG